MPPEEDTFIAVGCSLEKATSCAMLTHESNVLPARLLCCSPLAYSTRTLVETESNCCRLLADTEGVLHETELALSSV